MRILVAAILIAAIPGSAGAVPPTCDTLNNPIYLQVGDTQHNLMLALGRVLRDNTAKPITLVWFESGSCTNISVMYTGGPQLTAAMMYVPSTAENPTWTLATGPLSCNPVDPPGTGVLPDIGNSAVFNSACTTTAPPSTLTLEIGPRQAYVMAVPKASVTQNAITFEEAYFLFGFGPTILQSMNAAIAPWTDETQLFIRTTTKSTLLGWAANISVPAASWHGKMEAASTSVVSDLETAANPNTAIGILGDEVYDPLRASLSILAFKAKDQYAAYYPDSTSTSRDKANIRDGHYTVWSPTVWMFNTDGGGNAVKPDAKYVVDMIAGLDVTPAPNFEPTVVVASVGVVPDCAMRVQRSFEGGPLSLYKPPISCSCKFESAVETTSCAVCNASTPCATGTCRAGYCEEF